MKRCPRCGQRKDYAAFFRNRRQHDGRSVYCKFCHTADAGARAKALRNAEPDKVRQRDRARYRYIKKGRQPRLFKHHELDPGYYRRKNAAWIRANPVKNLRAARRLARKLDAPGRGVTEQDWLEILDRFGHKCLSCLRSDVPLEADHVVPLVKGGAHDPDNIQPLCRRCNSGWLAGSQLRGPSCLTLR